MRSTILTLLATILALILGVLLGLIISIVSTNVPVTVLRKDSRPLVSVVEIAGLTDGHLTGKMRGDVRFFLSGNMVIADGSGAFRAPAASLVKNAMAPRVPAGMTFAASKRGTKYYPVTSRSAQNLSPENRIYFRSAEEAETAGYVRGN